MFRKSLYEIVRGILVVALSVVFVLPARAASTAAGSNSVTITPITFELYANPGETLTEKIKVRNTSNAAGTFQIKVEDFTANGEQGGVDLIDDGSNATFSLAKWVFPEPKRISLKGKQEKEVKFTIQVPKNAEPGGHYASILVTFGGNGSSTGSGAYITNRVGSLLLLRVAGNVKEGASVESFKTSKGYYDKSPVTFELRVKNSGSNHIKPTGQIVITNLFGQKITQMPLGTANVLPEAIRRMDTEWRFTKLFANRYTATLVGEYGDTNAGKRQQLSATTSFIIFPKYLALALFGVIIIILAMVTGRKTIRKMIHNLTK